MHIYFSGIGGTAIGPLALIAKQAGYTVSGSDKQSSTYTQHLQKAGITSFHIGQSQEQIKRIHSSSPIDLFVYSSAVEIEQADHPELVFCRSNKIKTVKRDELINLILEQKKLSMIAIAGTHGKTTTTAMTIWLFKQLGIPVSYSVGAKISFGEMGHYDENSTYFVYEADEYDRNFLAYTPSMSIITGIDWDHADIYPSREDYNQAFRQFIQQSSKTYLWQDDAKKLAIDSDKKIVSLKKEDHLHSSLTGKVNRENAAIVSQAMTCLFGENCDYDQLVMMLNDFPGVMRRFEKLSENIYSDYAHTPPKIEGALQLAREIAGNNVVVVYEGLHNTRQHFIKDELPRIFKGIKKVYVVPSYRAREDESLEDLTPQKLASIISKTSSQPALLNSRLKDAIDNHRQAGDIVLLLSAGGGGSLDEWARQEFQG